MPFASQEWVLSSAIVLLLLLGTPLSHALWNTQNNIKESVFLSPKFELGPGIGSVLDKYYYDIEFPRGHVALKSFNAEVIDEEGNSIPLHETYLHHWVVVRYHQRKGVTHTGDGGHRVLHESDHIIVRNSGICQKNSLSQYFGLGSETRGTATDIPDPFGIEIGNPAEIPNGYEEKWMLNVHAIDTRGVQDRSGCTECRCDLYNVTMDQYGQPLRPGYLGGLHCCYDNTQCRVKEGFEGPKRSLYLKYTVKWVDWDNSVVPVKIYILDVTDKLQILNDTNAMSTEHNCVIKMRFFLQHWVLSSAIVVLLLLLATPHSHASRNTQNNIKEAVFFSPKFELKPGSVSNKYYYDIEFPRGHVAIKSFTGEVIDEEGNSIPLHETYLHHWLVFRYHQRKGVTHTGHGMPLTSDFVMVRNSGLCQKDFFLSQYFGLGSETRKTATYIPDPFGIEIGNPAEIPDGYEEKWLLNVHAIDTRGVQDRLGCTECRCDLYNVTKDEYGKPLRPGYLGGLYCYYDKTQCRVKEGFEAPKRSLYLKYTVKWIDWDDSVVPVKIYILDVTDKLMKLNDSKAMHMKHNCQVEYEVEPCRNNNKDSNSCIDVRRKSLPMPSGGYVIYGVNHQHLGGVGSTLYGQDGRVICSSKPHYGRGKKAGNEAGYIVGMGTCYPKHDSVQIFDGETLTLESNYSSRRHTGLMGWFYLLVAEKLPLPDQHSMHLSHA